MRLSKFLVAIFLTVVFSVLHFQAVSWAGPLVPAGTAILLVDGQVPGTASPDTTVSPTFLGLSSGGIDFGQRNTDGTFSPIASGDYFIGGTVIDYAVQFGGSVFSMTNPNGATLVASFGDNNLIGNEQIPVSVGDYYNSLGLAWSDIDGVGSFRMLVLNAGAGDNDGFAAVPIPPVAFLFGTGMIGLIGIARRNLFVK